MAVRRCPRARIPYADAVSPSDLAKEAFLPAYHATACRHLTSYADEHE